MLKIYGVSPAPAVNLMAQYAGLGSLAIGLFAWSGRNIEESVAIKTFIPAFLITYTLGVIISVLGTLSGIMQAGWAVVGIYGLFAISFTYFQFIKRT